MSPAQPPPGQNVTQQASLTGAGDVAVAKRPLGVFELLVAAFVVWLLWTLSMAGCRAIQAARSVRRAAGPPPGVAIQREPPSATVSSGASVAAWPRTLADLSGKRPVITATLTDIASEPEAYVGKIIRTAIRLNGFSMQSFRRRDDATGKAFRCWTVMAWDGVRPLGAETVGSQYDLSEHELNVIMLKDGMGRGIQDALNANGLRYFGKFGAIATVQTLALNGRVYELLVIHRVDAQLADGTMAGAISEEAFAN